MIQYYERSLEKIAESLMGLKTVAFPPPHILVWRYNADRLFTNTKKYDGGQKYFEMMVKLFQVILTYDATHVKHSCTYLRANQTGSLRLPQSMLYVAYVQISL